jgi:hypothetical protein
MPVLPDTDIGRVEFFESHIDQWTANTAALGLTAPAMAALATAIGEARTAYDDAQVARNESKASTQNFYNKVATMVDLGSDAIKAIKLKAAQDNDPDVFVLANIPAPAEPTPAGAPEAPEALVAIPNADGTVTLKWQGSVANRTHFTVWRRLATDSGGWDMIGSCSRRSFIDDAVPAPGSGSNGNTPMTILYHVRAQRGSFVSQPSITATITYGSDSATVAGTIGASIGTEDELSIAA